MSVVTPAQFRDAAAVCSICSSKCCSITTIKCLVLHRYSWSSWKCFLALHVVLLRLYESWDIIWFWDFFPPSQDVSLDSAWLGLLCFLKIRCLALWLNPNCSSNGVAVAATILTHSQNIWWHDKQKLLCLYKPKERTFFRFTHHRLVLNPGWGRVLWLFDMREDWFKGFECNRVLIFFSKQCSDCYQRLKNIKFSTC